MKKSALKELKEWCIVFNDNDINTTFDDISEAQAYEINEFMKEDGFTEKQILDAWNCSFNEQKSN